MSPKRTGLAIALLSLACCSPSSERFSANDRRLLQEPPIIATCGDHAYLTYHFGSTGFFFEPQVAVEQGKLVFSMEGTSSRGDLAGKRHFAEIAGEGQPELARNAPVYWREPDGSLLELQKASWPCPSQCSFAKLQADAHGEPASRSEELETLCEKLAKRLPENWAVGLRRDAKLSVASRVHIFWQANAPGNQPERPFYYDFTVRLGDRLTPDAYLKRKQNNSIVGPEAEAVYDKMESFACDELDYNKYGSECFRPRTRRQKRLLKEFEKLKAQIVELPQGFVGDHAMVFVERPVIHGDDAVVEFQEVERVRAEILGAIEAYPEVAGPG